MRILILFLLMLCFLIPPHTFAMGAYGEGGEPNGSGGSSSNR